MQIAINLNECKAELLKRSFYKFVQEFWSINIAEEPVWNWHIKALCDELQPIVERLTKREVKKHDLICNIPPGTTKSTIFSQMLPAWAWAIDPTLRILNTSYSESLAKDHAMYSRNIIRSDRYKLYFPQVELSPDRDTTTDYRNTLNGQRVAAGIGGTITGKHFHLIIIDDPLNPKQAASETECNNANSTIDNTLSTRKVDKEVTVTMLVMQRLATNDPTGHLLDKKGKKIMHIKLPAELKDGVEPKKFEEYYKGGLLDTKRLSKVVLDEALADLGTTNYAGQFAQRPAPATGAIWKKWFIEIEDKLWPTKKQFSEYGTDWDTAYTEKEDNAASAYFTAGKIGNDIYLDDFDFDWLEFPELIKWIKSRPSPHYIEDKASGKSLKQTLVKNGINAILVPVRGGDKVARAKMATPPAEAGRVYIRKSLVDKLYNDPKQGILNFPRGKYKDVADVLAQCLQRLDKKSVVVVSDNTSDDLLDGLFLD